MIYTENPIYRSITDYLLSMTDGIVGDAPQ